MTNKTSHWIHHTLNGGEQQVTLPEGKKVLVNGLCLANNTVYQFHSCFFHRCPNCYEAKAPTPHRVKIVQTLDGRREKVPSKFGQLYANTVRIEEEIKNTGYNLEVM